MPSEKAISVPLEFPSHVSTRPILINKNIPAAEACPQLYHQSATLPYEWNEVLLSTTRFDFHSNEKKNKAIKPSLIQCNGPCGR
jgi:hypothetical protein